MEKYQANVMDSEVSSVDNPLHALLDNHWYFSINLCGVNVSAYDDDTKKNYWMNVGSLKNIYINDKRNCMLSIASV